MSAKRNWMDKWGDNRFAAAIMLGLFFVSMPAVSREAWVVQEQASAIDGSTIKAVKGYRMPNSNAYFIATVKCAVDLKRIEVTVGSYLVFGTNVADRVADPYATVRNLIVRIPAGRAKAKGYEPTSLGDLFSLARTSNNTIVLNASKLVDSKYEIPDDLTGIGSNAINPARAVRDALPLGLELNNQSGQYEIVVDASPEAEMVLGKCGGNENILDAKEVAKFRVARQREAVQQRQDDEQQTHDREQHPEQNLLGRYRAALQEAVLRNWTPGRGVRSGQRCPIQIRQLPGGEVIDVQVDGSCSFDQSDRRSIQAAVIKAQPLPYAGFEAVFARSLLFTFVAP